MCKITGKQVISLLLCAAMLLSNIPVVSFAAHAEALCQHHPEHLECGYVEGESGCGYVCEVCMQPEEVPTEPEATEETVEPDGIIGLDTVTTEFSVQSAPDVDLPENEELFSCFVEQELYGYGMATYGIAARKNLTDTEKAVYDALKLKIEAVAANGGSTVILLPSVSDLKTTWTNTELGVTSIDDPTVVQAALEAQFDLTSVLSALLMDCPLELYWYDKTAGVKMDYQIQMSGYEDGIHKVWDSATVINLTFTFAVSADYGAGDHTVTTDVAKIAAARNSAAQVVANHAGKSDYEKLVAYKDYICAAVTYNQSAADDVTTPYGDPWQLISVFDGDSETNVVCEGYSKAFQYLCDLTTFAGDTACYTVEGKMDGGNHMWNIVTLEGANYLVDVTNSDAGSIGAAGGLFLAGGTGSIAQGYTVGGCHYTYDAKTVNCWGDGADSILTISDMNYASGGDVEEDDNLIATGSCGDNLTWKLDCLGNLTISGSGNLTSSPWHDYVKSIKTIVVDEGVTNIYCGAFSGCSNLESITLPFVGANRTGDPYRYPFGHVFGTTEYANSVETSQWYKFNASQKNRIVYYLPVSLKSVTITDGDLPDCAFSGCKYLTDINITADINTTGSETFYDCINLRNVTFPDSLTTIGYGAFWNCSGLTSFSIPDSVVTIGADAFHFCKNLESVTMSDSVTSIGFSAFEACKKLTSIKLSGSLTSIAKGLFAECDNLPNIVIPDDVVNVERYAFGGCDNLEKIIFSSELTNIDEDAFADCWSLTEIVFQGNAPRINTNAFSGVIATAYYPSGDRTWNEKLQDYGGELTWVAYCKHDFKEIVLEENLVRAANCISANVYYKSCKCGEKSSETFTHGETDPYAHELDSDGKCVRCGKNTFMCGENLTWSLNVHGELIISGTGPMMPNAFDNYMAAIKTVVIKKGVTSIGAAAFFGSGLTDIEIPDSVTSIGKEAFRNCGKLPSITIPKGVTSIGDGAFAQCDSLREIYFVGNAPEIAETAFGGKSRASTVITAYYPAGNATWSEDVLRNYGGNIVWKLWHPDPNGHIYDDIVDGTCNVCGVDRAEVAVRKKHNMFRMYNPYTMEHFYTGSEVERDNLVAVGWRYEGIAFTFPANMGAPVHRLYDPATGEHLYTMNEAEKADLMAKGWNYEGIAFNSGFDTEAVQHRLHNPYETVGSYHFTFSQEEMNNLIAAGWVYQGIGWYSCFK